jgi:hypothetical protein
MKKRLKKLLRQILKRKIKKFKLLSEMMVVKKNPHQLVTVTILHLSKKANNILLAILRKARKCSIKSLRRCFKSILLTFPQLKAKKPLTDLKKE